MFIPARSRLYVDGSWLASQACNTVDASINWLDVAALARRLGCGEPMNACYFGICDPEDPASEAPVRALAQALEALGVTCHIRCEPADSVECSRCGHGWEHAGSGLLAADLALQVAEDAATDAIDHALIVGARGCADRLATMFRRCYPGKTVDCIEPHAAELRSLRLGRSVQLAPGATLLRPARWTGPGAGTRRMQVS